MLYAGIDAGSRTIKVVLLDGEDGAVLGTAVTSQGVRQGELARELFDRFHDMVTSEVDAPIDQEKLGKMAVFSGVREFPMRVKCATLAWHTARSALEEEDTPISTE